MISPLNPQSPRVVRPWVDPHSRREVMTQEETTGKAWKSGDESLGAFHCYNVAKTMP